VNMSVHTSLKVIALPKVHARSVRKQGKTFAVSAKASSTSETVFNFEKVEKVKSKASAAMSAAVITSMTSPLLAEASVTPSLKNTLLCVVAGGVVLGAIAAAVIGVSSFDKVSRK